jgi:phenylacetate-coenzyme A ligase PaaK-like adenylate-forming protein
MPSFTKKDIRDSFPQGLLPPGRNINLGLAEKEIQLVETSGTTDDKVTNIWNQKWWDASERASWQLNSHARAIATGDHHEAILVNPRNVGFISDNEDLPMEKRRLSRYLYLNEKTDPTAWTPALMDRMIQELSLFQPGVLEANPSYLARLCRYITAAGKTAFQPGLITFTYEYPSRLHYRQIRRVFQVPMASSYGTTETGYVFMQCENGKFHQNSNLCRVDFQPFKPEHGGPRLGRILVTPFNNPWNYLLRFDVGDLVSLEADCQCSCGRHSGLVLNSIEGRKTNLTLTCQGRLVTLNELDQAISLLAGIDEYKMIQSAACTYDVQIASSRTDKQALLEDVILQLKRLYGQDAVISVVFVASIATENSGKYQLAKTLFPLELEKYLDTVFLPKIPDGVN